MTTESTSTSGAHTTRAAPAPAAGGLALAPQRGARGRTTAPRPRPVPQAPFVAALVAVECAAVLPAATVLTPGQRSAALLLQLTACAVALHACAGLYRPTALGAVRAGRYAGLLDELPVLAGRLAVAWCAVAALLAARSPEQALVPGTLAGAYALHLAVVAAGRAAVHHRRRRVARDQPCAALVVGAVPAAQRLAALLLQHPEYGVRPVGLVGPAQDIPQPAGAEAPTGPALPLLAAPEDVQRAVIQNGVQDALFVPGDEGAPRAEQLALLRRHGCATWLVGPPARVGARFPGAAPDPMGRHLWGYAFRLLEAPGPRPGRAAKRALDVAGAGLLLLAAAPVLLLCAAVVRLADGPGILFRQERVGEGGRLFTLLKFRTLRPADAHEAATRWSVAHDERLGTVGSFLRRTSLDELPQLWNVLRGDMSLVGPRPERPYFVDRFSRLHGDYAARHRMPAGLTGLAQVHGLRGDTSIEDRCRFDNHYIDHWSLGQDVRILLRTAATLIRPAGS
ncbi:exopolysaccharide biosynthesis polyprenyl glycosylphosphotransferase [Streptomyces kanasensis]|uniref:exopolysaccharide biosynthesis polyprenyl glycosylphosphotransferase n=1 Tax=Streptomyces kanasensis TaxID=936756 RepID=UPI0037020A45